MVQTTSVSVPANNTNSNVLSNKRIARIPSDGGIYQVTIGATGSATGLEHEVFSGNANPVERSIVSTANRVPQLQYDLVTVFQARGGEELTVAAHNTTAGALTYFLTVAWERVR